MATLTFTQALTQAEAQAVTTLPAELHERLSAAMALAKEGRVFHASDGSWQVDSTSQVGLTHSVNGHCDCPDVHFNKPPQGLCKHRIAVYLVRRTMQLMASPAGPVVPVELQMPQEPASPPLPAAALPEAPTSPLKPEWVTEVHGVKCIKYRSNRTNERKVS